MSGNSHVFAIDFVIFLFRDVSRLKYKRYAGGEGGLPIFGNFDDTKHYLGGEILSSYIGLLGCGCKGIRI